MAEAGVATGDRSMEHLLALAALPPDRISAAARRMAAFSLFDWMVVALAGADQPLSHKIRDFVASEGGRPVATVLGGDKAPARAAALANGTISHALDYDDTHFAHVGHLSVGIYPAALAAGEEADASAAAVRDAFVLGAEAACRLGVTLGRGHYERGFHQTATAGAFGAAIAAARIYALDSGAVRNALGLTATRASGLKSQFGTMGKPFNAGIAASNGVEAAALAARGFTSCDDGVSGPQGFVETHSDAPDPAAAWAEPPPGRFLFEGNTYKLHACCHGLHATIEALLKARAEDETLAETATAIDVRTNPRWLRVCDIKAPRTGLEVKFSYAWLAAMALTGVDTAAERTYSDALARDPALAGIARRVRVTGDSRLSDTQAAVTVDRAGGAPLEVSHDLADPIPPDLLQAKLRHKAESLIGRTRADRIWAGVADIDTLSARELAALLRA